jgi:outer membrane receptor protein involved in Fe transport
MVYNPAASHYTLSAYCDNISNRAVYTGGNFIGTGQLAPNGYGYYAVSIDPPRTYGIRVKVHF